MNQSDIKRFYEQLGIRVRKARKKTNNLSQGALAKMLELSRTSVVNIEKGRQRIQVHTLLHIANLLNTKPEDLIPTEIIVEQTLPLTITSKLTQKELPSVANILSALNNNEDGTHGKDKANSKRITVEIKDHHTTRRSRKDR